MKLDRHKRSPNRLLDEPTKQKAIELYWTTGLSCQKIADMLGMSHTRVWRLGRENKPRSVSSLS